MEERRAWFKAQPDLDCARLVFMDEKRTQYAAAARPLPVRVLVMPEPSGKIARIYLLA